MGIFVTRSIVLGHILLIILNKHSLLALCRAGVLSKIFSHTLTFANAEIYRCTASSKNLDEGDWIPQSEEHTEMLVWAFELGDLWYAYDIVGDIIVCSPCLSFYFILFI